MKQSLWTYLRGDKGIWVIVLMLSLVSILAIYSSTGTLAYRTGQGTEYYVLKHFLLLCFGLMIMYVAHKIPYVYYSRISQLLLIVAIPLLIYALFSSSGGEVGRWITLPVIKLTFQPSDVAKLALVMYIARILAKEKDRIKERSPFLHIIFATLLVCGLIFPANFSTSALVFLTAMVMMFIGQINLRYIFSTLAVCVTGVVLLFTVLMLLPDDNKLLDFGRLATMKGRVERFVKPTGETQENFQAEQAKIAIARGGFLPNGPGTSTQRNILPEPYNDFIYAIIIEEYGFIGGLVILMLYLMLMFRAISISRQCEGTFGSYLVLGIAFLLVTQALVNMAVAVGLFPVTGQPLPFLSMGGTALWLTSLGIGIILSVSVAVQETENKESIDLEEVKPQPAEEIAKEMGIEN
jgi:cell division protein FtsW